jgi:hypothetical protein
MTAEQDPQFDRSVADEAILSMFSDALGYEVTRDTMLTTDEELTAGAAVQLRLDTVSEQMRKMRDGEQVDIDALMDSKAQVALLEIDIDRRTH